MRFSEPLEIQTIQPEKCLKQTNELGYDGHMLPTYTNGLQSHSSHIDILRDNSIYDNSHT